MREQIGASVILLCDIRPPVIAGAVGCTADRVDWALHNRARVLPGFWHGFHRRYSRLLLTSELAFLFVTQSSLAFSSVRDAAPSV